jgi:hypothetical protein
LEWRSQRESNPCFSLERVKCRSSQALSLSIGGPGKIRRHDICLWRVAFQFSLFYPLRHTTSHLRPCCNSIDGRIHSDRRPVRAEHLLLLDCRGNWVAIPSDEDDKPSLGGWQAEWPTLAALIETLGSAVQAMGVVAMGLTIDPDALQANMDATEGAVLAERATFLLAEKMGKQKAGKLVEDALAKGGSFVEALGQLEKELSDEMALLGYSPKFVDRLLAELRRQ